MPQQLRPTFSESWYRVADLKAKLRGSAQISRQYYRGERWYVVRDPAGNQFHRLSAAAYKFVGLLDGTRTVAEAWDLVGGQLADDAPTQNEVIQIMSQLHAANLMETDITPDAKVLLRRHKRMQKQQWQGRLMNVLFPRIPLWDPDRFLCRWMPVIRPFLSPLGTILWLAVVIPAIVMLVPEWTQLKAGAEGATNPNNWPFLWATFVLIKLIHELGHAFSCRRFGGEVHELGIMFLVFIPTPYVDASTAWSFPNKWARMFVGAGGMIIELFVAAICAFVWVSTAPGRVHDLAYNTMLIASVSTVIFNANPLLRYDGYYILSDYLEIPNLRYRAQEYAMGLIKRHLFGVKSQQPLPPVGQRFWLFFYAVSSGAYRVLVGVTIILVVTNKVPVLGVLMALGGLATWLIVPIFKVGNYLLLDPELHRKRGRAMAWTFAFAAAVIGFVGLIPWSTNYEAVGVLEPADKVTVKAQTPGVVKTIMVKHGAKLHGPHKVDGKDVAGDIIIVCEDPKLSTELTKMQLELKQTILKREWARINDMSQFNPVDAQVSALEDNIADVQRRIDELTVDALIDGELIAPELHNLQGKYMQLGEEIATVAQTDKLRVSAIVSKDDEELVNREPKNNALIRLAGMLDIELHAFAEKSKDGSNRTPLPQWEAPSAAVTYAAGGEVPVDPQDKTGKKLQQPQVVMWVILDNPAGLYMPGQRAYVRIDLEKRPLAWTLKRRIWQLVQKHSHGKWL